jgi:DNA polymerase-3 subunit delta
MIADFGLWVRGRIRNHKSAIRNFMADRIYVIAGKEPSLVTGAWQQLLDRLLEPAQRMTGLSPVEGDAAVVSDVLDELRTIPFLTKQRVVVVREAEGFISRHRELLERYFENPSPTGVLVLLVSTWPKTTRLAKRLPAVGELIEVNSPKRSELPRLIAQYAQDTHGKRLDREAADMLVEIVGDSLPQLRNEVDKLALFARQEKVITAAHVESLSGHYRIYDAFEVIDAMTAGDAGGAVKRLRNMFEQDKSAEYTAVGAFAFHLRRMFQAKVLLDKRINPAQIATQLRIWGNKDRFFAQLQRTTLSQIGAVLEDLAAIDYATKTGQSQTPIAIEQLILKLAGTKAATPRARA